MKSFFTTVAAVAVGAIVAAAAMTALKKTNLGRQALG
jgi:hypothetical protein